MMRTHFWQRVLMTAAAATMLGAAHAVADSITLRGSTIPLRDVTVLQIRNGELYYRDHNGRPMQRGLDEIDSIGFDGLPKLDRAERAFDAGESDRALEAMLQALLNAENDLQRLWLHARLSRVHNVGGEYVQAASHAAATMLIEPSPYWRVLEPTCEPREASFAAVREADELLREALQTISNGTLRTTLERMRSVVQPLRRQLEREYDGPPIADGSTWSGYTKIAIERGELFGDETEEAPASARDDADAPAESQTRHASQEPSIAEPADDAEAAAERASQGEPQPVRTDPRTEDNGESTAISADEIDALLNEGEYKEALQRCEQAATNVADRNVGKLLLQWGRALNGVDRPRDAAVKFTECAVLFNGTASGVEALIETANIYDRVYRKPTTSRRLLRRAIERAELQGRAALASRAREALSALGGSGSN